MSDSKPSVILMGSKPGSVVALSILRERGWDIRCVAVTRSVAHPWVGGPDLEDAARAAGLPVVTQAELPDDQAVDFVISYMFRYRVRPEVIRLAQRAALNFHAGPLPEFGGFAYYNVAILEDARQYGCTCHYMDEGFDTGPLLKVRRFPIHAAEETAYSLERKAQQEMIRLFLDFCRLAETQDELPVEQQDPSRMRYLTRREFEALKQIPPDASSETAQRIARAFWYPPYPCAYYQRNGLKIEVVPEMVREELARHLHVDDLAELQAAAAGYQPEGQP